jgi:hypothetical protein
MVRYRITTVPPGDHYRYTGEVPYFYGKYRAVAVTENVVVAVGWLEGRAVVLRGYRN